MQTVIVQIDNGESYENHDIQNVKVCANMEDARIYMALYPIVQNSPYDHRYYTTDAVEVYIPTANDRLTYQTEEK